MRPDCQGFPIHRGQQDRREAGVRPGASSKSTAPAVTFFERRRNHTHRLPSAIERQIPYARDRRSFHLYPTGTDARGRKQLRIARRHPDRVNQRERLLIDPELRQNVGDMVAPLLPAHFEFQILGHREDQRLFPAATAKVRNSHAA